MQISFGQFCESTKYHGTAYYNVVVFFPRKVNQFGVSYCMHDTLGVGVGAGASQVDFFQC